MPQYLPSFHSQGQFKPQHVQNNGRYSHIIYFIIVFMIKLILLIDDDADEIGILSEALERTGSDSKCNWAQGAEMAYDLLEDNQPDLILLDYNMPGKDGLNCLEQLRKNKELQHVPIVMYSTYIDSDLETKAMNKGAFSCIQKTTSVYELVNELKQLFTQV
jgi:CheY-like chemotaxis protein